MVAGYLLHVQFVLHVRTRTQTIRIETVSRASRLEYQYYTANCV